MKTILAFDLTKGRYNLLKIPQEIVKEMENSNFVSAVNCFFAIRFKDGTNKHFNNEYEFHSWLTFSRRWSLSYRNRFIDLHYKSIDWFLCNRNLPHEIIKLQVGFIVTSILHNTRQHDNTRQHEYNTTQHETTQVQHETTRVQHKTTRDNTSATRDNTSTTQDNMSTTRVQSNLKVNLV